MTAIVEQIIHPCAEHSEVALPITDLLGPDGRLDIYPDISGKGYFDIDYRRGELVLKSRGYVGLIPISDRIAIRVEPRTPIASLMYMIWRSGSDMVSLKNHFRTYRELPGTVADPERLYVETFIDALRSASRSGLLKQYQRYDTDSEMRGRLLFAKTVSRFRSKGVRHVHVFDVTENTVSNAANRILKCTTERLLQRVRNDPTTFSRDTLRTLQTLLEGLASVQVGLLTRETIARQTPQIIRMLPNSHRIYESALWLSYLIATNSGVAMEAVGRAKFESVIIDVSGVFERYVRKLCEEAAGTDFGGCNVMNGNQTPIPLFVSGGKSDTKPDIYFRRGTKFLAVADAKYKPKISTEDRYELLAFCEAMRVDIAAFIVPRKPADSDAMLHGQTAAGRKIHIVPIDLNPSDHVTEEARFTKTLGSTLGF